MKILNLYSGIGGNRKLWTPNGDEHEITAVELNPKIAKIYCDFFPNDKMIIADAHEYLLEHFKEYDFIWSSPPCPTHSRLRFMITKRVMGNAGHDQDIIYADMRLYQEIILLQYYYKGLYCVENVKSYYEPLITPKEIGRHYIWANFLITDICDSFKVERVITIKQQILNTGFDISNYSGIRKDTTLRNLVNPEFGLHILNCAMGIYIHNKDVKQLEIGL